MCAWGSDGNSREVCSLWTMLSSRTANRSSALGADTYPAKRSLLLFPLLFPPPCLSPLLPLSLPIVAPSFLLPSPWLACTRHGGCTRTCVFICVEPRGPVWIASPFSCFETPYDLPSRLRFPGDSPVSSPPALELQVRVTMARFVYLHYPATRCQIHVLVITR